jgi:N-acetylmuramic acid 6-phosphate etherase
MLSEEAQVAQVLGQHRAKLATAIARITQRLKRGGRLFYVGAGTSGRLGVLDASECPPTFRTDPAMVQGIIAGGDPALRRSVEGAEDDPTAGAAAVSAVKAGPRDVVVGIAASGTTPYVWGALAEAKSRQATTILLCFNPGLVIPRELQPWLVLAVDLGPEVLTGSTRLKAGTATKLVLNLFSTLTMVRLGKVVSNLMVDVNPSNAKLRNRAVRITGELTGADEATARAALEDAGWVVKKAIARLNRQRRVPGPRTCP